MAPPGPTAGFRDFLELGAWSSRPRGVCRQRREVRAVAHGLPRPPRLPPWLPSLRGGERVLVGMRLVGSHTEGQALLTSPGQGGQRHAGRQRTVRACPGWMGRDRGWWGRAGGQGAPTNREVVGEAFSVDVLVLLQEHADDEPVHLHQGLFRLGRRGRLPGCWVSPPPSPCGVSPALSLGRSSTWV